MSYSNYLRQEEQSIFREIYQHPFVQGIADGKLPQNSIIHYVQQDTQYLDTYCRVYGLALAKSRTPHQLRLFFNRIGVLLEGETIPHQNLCTAAGVVHSEITRRPVELAPTAYHYSNHLLSIAQTGTLGEIVAAVLPCHQVYVDIAQRMMRDIRPTEDHPFYQWLTFYSSESMVSGLSVLTSLVDELAESADETYLCAMQSAYRKSCWLEYAFFDMAFQVEDWALRRTSQ
ncbi:thiaminase II [Alicyclobacillus sp. SO9]|uniref:thiaminase II n=1 Tax=Alicyclobacillus sp. SO9 TaxID=2665646 RepID=UPI0018E86A10|nr:thiaminase II [Alicyclobacillus sp. SO9]QQE78707.1 thiaminase II [Alicyclobacillus sp. SO9]